MVDSTRHVSFQNKNWIEEAQCIMINRNKSGILHTALIETSSIFDYTMLANIRPSEQNHLASNSARQARRWFFFNWKISVPSTAI